MIGIDELTIEDCIFINEALGYEFDINDGAVVAIIRKKQ